MKNGNKNHETVNNFYSTVVNAANNFNSRNKKGKRFFPMTNKNRNMVTEIGLYDGQTKKWILCDTNHPNVEQRIKGMFSMIKNAEK